MLHKTGGNQIHGDGLAVHQMKKGNHGRENVLKKKINKGDLVLRIYRTSRLQNCA